MLGAKAEAEDATQKVLLQATLRTWVWRIASDVVQCPDYAAPLSIGARLRALIDSGTVRLFASSILVHVLRGAGGVRGGRTGG